MKTSVRFLILLVLLAIVAPARAAVVWEVVRADETGVQIRVTTAGSALEAREDGASVVLLPGAHPTGEPGYPSLPADARWIALPPGAVPRLTVLSTEVEDLGSGRLAPVPSPSLSGDAGDGPSLVEREVFAEDYDAFRHDAAQVVTLGAPVHQRRQRMAPVGISPVLYDAGSGRVRVVRAVEFRVDWPAPTRLPDGGVRPDTMVLRSVLNPEQAREWSSLTGRQQALVDASREPDLAARAPAVGIGPFDAAALAADAIRLRVDQSGIVRVGVADLMAAGGLPGDVPRSWLRVVQMRGSEPGTPGYPAPLAVDVAVHFLGRPDESGNLATTDEIYFHALRVEDDGDTLSVDGVRALPALPWGESDPTDLIAPRYSGDHYNATNVYWVLLMPPPSGGWSRMEAVPLAPSGGNPATEYVRVEHFEGNRCVRDEPRDHWVERYAWNRRDEVDVARAVRFVNPVPGANILVRWSADEHIAVQPTEQIFSVRQNGTDVELLRRNLSSAGVMTDWAGTLAGSAGMQDGPAEFRMRRVLGTGDIGVNAFLDHVEFEYPALFVASGDELRFRTGSTAGAADVEVTGYSRSDLLCFDVTDPRAPRWIDLGAGNVIDRSAGGPANFVLSLQVPQAPGEERTLWAAPRVEYTRVGRDAIERDRVADLFATVDDVQVLAIGPEEFRTQVDRWIAWREQTYAGTGWNFAYVDVQQIYDEFSGGLESPWAIRAFVEWAWLQWDTVALVLVGDGSEDPFDASGRAGPNLVPPALHVQSFSGLREILASDKWYGLFGYEAQGINQYPEGLSVTSDLLVGRMPVGNETELATLIDKIIAYEQTAPDAAWRRRTLWVSDDAYSTDLIGAGSGDCYKEQTIEDQFRASQLQSARLTSASLDSTVTGELLNADDYTRDCRTGAACENLSGVRQCYLAEPVRRFIDRWNEGWLWLSYQGHAAYNVLGHENLVLAQNMGLIANNGRPWVFFGMGCHVSDFIRFEEAVDGRSLGELFLLHPTAGAIGTYASTGFEFLSPNRTFMEVLAETMFERRVPESPVFGTAVRNQWILGDVMARGELETLALRSSIPIYKGDEMIAQYNVLGDPLLRMDAGAPRMEVSRGGTRVNEGGVIDADPSLPFAAIDLELVDESGLDRVEITDSAGRDYSTVVPALSGPDPRVAQFSVDLPVYPQAYSVEIATFDAARAELRRSVLTLNVPLPVDFSVDGAPVAPGSAVALQVGVPRSMTVDFTSPVDLVEADIQLDYPGVDLVSLGTTGSGRDWSVEFDAVLRASEEPGALNLVLQGQRTELVTSSTAPGGLPPVVLRHVVFPNPMQNLGRIVVQVEGLVDRARLSVYDVAGNEVSARELGPGASAPHQERGTSFAFEFEARDRRGDELANGTYFYRISVEGPDGSARSDMGRLVIMR